MATATAAEPQRELFEMPTLGELASELASGNAGVEAGTANEDEDLTDWDKHDMSTSSAVDTAALLDPIYEILTEYQQEHWSLGQIAGHGFREGLLSYENLEVIAAYLSDDELTITADMVKAAAGPSDPAMGPELDVAVEQPQASEPAGNEPISSEPAATQPEEQGDVDATAAPGLADSIAATQAAATPIADRDYHHRYQAYLSALDAWREQRRDAEHAHSQAGLEMARAQARLKTCREIFKDATEALLMIDASEPVLSKSAATSKSAVPAKEKPAADWSPLVDLGELVAAATSEDAPEAATALADDLVDSDPNAWRSAPTPQLDLAGVPRLGPKKLEALYSACPTIGDLEDLRAKGSGKGVGLRSIKGIGEDAAQAIEDRVLAWLTKNRDQEAFAAAAEVESQSVVTAGVPASLLDDEPNANNYAAAIERQPKSAATPPVDSSNSPTTPDSIRHRAKQILSAAIDGSEDLEAKSRDVKNKTIARYIQAGAEAYRSGTSTSVTDCPWEAGDAMDDWIRGAIKEVIEVDGVEAAGEWIGSVD
jgi:hypothetical protein